MYACAHPLRVRMFACGVAYGKGKKIEEETEQKRKIDIV
jgi:hypothetical protein